MVTFYHNPRCSKSRETLALLAERGIAPEIVHYLDTPPDRQTLQILLQKLGMQSARELMRRKDPLYAALGLDRPDIGESALLDALLENPKLIERPIVINGDRARLGRPPEAVLEIL
ncbi:arsenate reductase [Pantoea sp. PA1]|jgi:arsenate reductase|uniref:Arsenate reductase n=1 Tax=Pantoea ananatis (strain LMG 20103) TaxID=706191 RepID=D4GK22_PANAM|nr:MULTISPECIES: arsenate reductase (glutaredoxin) [Pantoea]ADD77990.1 YfgD [Pantoea ananatis LMG 20103]MBA4822344.1 arsenate reductase (glutaredoxin) [Pantoea ananatis]MCH9270955.1 arsenate reductase (glutaredoxin) [Pantoea ananatis]MCS3402779.1 arsenate reductase (glutaredoxin) [Pantoea sp. B566]MCV3299945.1 arsenate reductase (glutaredoxin) [Pantoea ananatis]